MSATTAGGVNQGTSIAIGNGGNVYTTGLFNGTMDFDPGLGTYNLAPVGSFDVFISTLDNLGNFISAKQIGSVDFDKGSSIKTDFSGNIYVAGTFNQTADFDPCPGNYNLTSAGGYDIFVTKFSSPSISITASSTTICAGTSVIFTATSVNEGPTPSYQWQVNGVNVGANSPAYTTSTLSNGDVIRVVLTSNATCSPPTITTSNSITMIVNASVTASVVISTPATAICAGASVTFTASPTNGGSTTVYQWQVNGGNVGTNSPTYTTSTLANGDMVTVIMTSNATCATPPSPISNTITMTVSPGGPALVAITSTGSTICVGASVTFTATPTNGGPTPSYQWQVNGINVGTSSPTYTTNTLINGDVVTVIMTSSLSCATGSPATSNSISMTVVPPGPASVIISSTSSAICSGTSVTFTATPTNGGSTPSYQWQVNGVNAGTNSPTYTISTLSNGDVVTVIMTSNLSCATGSPTTSNSITITVTPSVTPSVNIVASSTAICVGASVTFTATPTNGGTTPVYQWKVNGANVGINSSTYTTTSLANGDVVTVMLTSNATCPSPVTVTSGAIGISVSSPVTPSINITVPSTTICVGTSVVFTATPANGGSSPSYQWQVNGTNVGTNSSSYTTSVLGNGDVVTAIMTSNAACATSNTVTSNSITMTLINTIITPSVSIASSPGNICFGTAVTFTGYPTNGGSSPSYQWRLNGSNIGTNSPVFISNTLANGDIINCLMTSNAICAIPNTALSNNITVVLDPAVCPMGFYMPTAFTPNKDGKNDVCKPTLLGNILSYKFSIYNRWGQKIFETTNLQKGWNGKVSGVDTDTNVFIWTCSFQFAGQTLENRKGTVVLIR
jgi:gliding motility-associated-like protein